MSWRSKGLPLAIFAIFFIQITSPMFQFPIIELTPNQSSQSSEVGFSSGSGHDLEGDIINVDGKNWTVRGESILDYWKHEIQNQTNVDSIDMVTTEIGLGYACSTNQSEVYFHTIQLNGDFETLVVQNLGSDTTSACAIGVTKENRIQIAYDISKSDDENNGSDIRLARLAEPNAVYLERTWHIRTIAENVYAGDSDGLNIEFDSHSQTHLFFRDSITHGLRHLSFNKAFWNQTTLDEGPIGSDIEIKIDPHDMFHLVYTYHPQTNNTENEVRLLRFNQTSEMRQVLARGQNITEAVGMDLDSNNIEQIAYSRSAAEVNDVALLRSLAGKDTGRINPVPTTIITYDDDSPEGDVLSGDLNGDGLDDLVYTDPEGNGTISIHYGSPSGLSENPDRMLVGSFSDSRLGTGIAIGDFNCDGFDDLASSEPGLAENNSGHVSVRIGNSQGLSEHIWWEFNGTAEDNLGWSMTSLGDVESDGCDDLAIVADKMIEENETQPTLSRNGLVMVLRGNETTMVQHLNITQTDFGTMFGRQIASGGDINGDGFLDMVISNTGDAQNPIGYSSVEFFYGSESGIVGTPFKVKTVSTQGKLYGFEMEFVGDIHNDGYDDLIITELFASTALFQSGKVHMWAGSSSGPVENWSQTGPYANALLGYTISPAGDINEDGFDDFMMMLPKSTKSGIVNLYLGSPNGPRNDVQLFAQGATGENVGLNLLAGMDFDGDGMGELLYSSRDLEQGDDFAPVLTILSERDWENIDFEFDHPVSGIDLLTPLRGSPTLMIHLSDSSLKLLENTPDGISSAGRWDYRSLTDVESAVMGISHAGKPLILAKRVIAGVSTMVTMTVNGNVALDYTLDSSTGVGQKMGSVVDNDGMERIGHFSSDYSSIFYTIEGDYGYTTSLVSSGIDLIYPIEMHVDSNQKTRMVYVDDDDNMVRLATLNGTWGEVSILNTTLGDDFDSLWAYPDNLIFSQVAVSNGSPYLQLVEYNGTNYSVTDIAPANLSASFELDYVPGKIAISVLDGQYLRVYERDYSGGNWTQVYQRWMLQTSDNTNNTLVMNAEHVLYDSNNSDQGILHRDEDGIWNVHSIDVPDSDTPHDFSVLDDRWYITATESSAGSPNLVWVTGTFSDSTIVTSTKFMSIVTEDIAAMEFVDSDLVIAYSHSSTKAFGVIRVVADADRDFIPDSHDDLPNIGNQWEDSDSDGYGDNPSGPQADACSSTSGTSIYDRYGCEDYDGDGWSDANDDCSSDDGTSWWGQVGCSDDDQDGWVDDAILGDRFPENWKQALDTDRDTFGDNHGPDCCDVDLESIERPGDYFPYNPIQYADMDGDGYGDNPDDPIDGDWCWFVEGYSWRDRQGCPDSDSDGSSDPWYSDNPYGTQYTWTEEDGADWWPNDGTQWADSDGDGFGDNSSVGATLPDKFPTIPAAANDTDGDGYPNNWTTMDDGLNRGGLNLDNCPDVAGNSTSSYVGGTVVPYYGCADTDGDGREDSTDAFPLDPTQLADTDGDGWGDNQQGNDPDACPFDFGVINGTKPNGDPGVGCPIETQEEDQDQDGVPDSLDDCDNTQSGQDVNDAGCSEYQIDDDLDGVPNAEDKCSNTPFDTAVDTDGCSSAQKEVDTDGDGVNDPNDLCPDSNPELTIDEDGCNLAQKDSDNDGVNDLLDQCPDTPPPIIVLINGCIDESKTDVDVDNDGFKGNYSYDAESDTHTGDAFPFDATQWHDKDGDGFGDSQAPGANYSDACPDVWGNSTEKFRYGCLDSDGDGYSDLLGDDAFPENPTQWEDQDKDGWGDNQDGEDADLCLNTTINELYLQEARENFGCALYQSDSDNDGIMDDEDACPNTPAGSDVYPSGCKIEVESEPAEKEEQIMGLEPMIFYAAAGGGGLLFLGLVFVIVSRMRGGDIDFDDDDDDDWYEEDEEEDFLSNILGGRTTSRGPNQGPVGGGPRSRGPPRGAPPSGPSGPPRNQNPPRGPPGGPSKGPSRAGPARGPDPRGPQRGNANRSGPSVGRKVAKRKPVSGDGKTRKAKVVIDPDLFDEDEISDRSAAVDWTITALKQGQSERSILMQLQTTGWSAPQSRAIIDLAKQ